jgi:DNA-binding FrmR family transcriptional regulator
MLRRMDAQAEVRKRREGLKRVLQRLEMLLGQSDAALDALASGAQAETGLKQLDRFRADLESAAREYLDQQATFSQYVRDQLRMIEQAKAAAAMSEKTKKPARDQARIQQLSEDLTRDLRLQRVDSAIKELLDFLADAEFFAANASTGRRRKLRALQNAIEKALEK